jgi:hypothetical protein
LTGPEFTGKGLQAINGILSPARSASTQHEAPEHHAA